VLRVSSGRSSIANTGSSRVHRREQERCRRRSPTRVEPICSLLQVAPSTLNAAKDRAPSARAVSDASLTPELVTLWEANYAVYGVRKPWKATRLAGHDIGSGADRPSHARSGH
jgi:hypothetical protein